MIPSDPIESRSEHGKLLSRPVPALLFALAAVIVAAAALLALAGKRREPPASTGDARWIWFTLDIDEPRPLRFYALRDFRLDSVPASAKARLFVDRRGSLVLNGSRFAPSEHRPGGRLSVLEVAPALLAGVNRAVIEAESPTGAGGILFSLELPEGRRVVSDGSWRVSLSQDDLARGGGHSAGVWGRPPMYPWGDPKE